MTPYARVLVTGPSMAPAPAQRRLVLVVRQHGCSATWRDGAPHRPDLRIIKRLAPGA
ncbi:MAG: hypothetical protein IPO93_03385 [Actinobacteria bacterium]|nr:hypothetical protein [Actinomycetota bacterium]